MYLLESSRKNWVGDRAETSFVQRAIYHQSMKLSIVVLGVVVLALASPRSSSANECLGATICERINGDVDVFVAKVQTEMDDDAAVRVHVLRSFKGSAKGEIPVTVFPAGDIDIPDYEIGASYLFYTWKEKVDGVTRRRHFGCGMALKLEEVDREELGFLEHLGSGNQAGEVSGEVKTFLAEDPIRDLKITLKSANREYSTKTDRNGKFKIANVVPGTYTLNSEGLSDDLMMMIETDDESFEISPHGCVDTLLLATHNATISGRIALPVGFDVEGISVEAFGPDGRAVDSANTDGEGRYRIVGIASGDYVIGIHAGRFPPTTAVPFPATYAPSAKDRDHAAKFHIETGTHLEDVDIVVNAASSTATIQLKAKFDDGAPITEANFGVSATGDMNFATFAADGAGSAVLPIVRGVRATVFGFGLTEAKTAKCMTPLAVGPDEYPEVLEVTLSEDGCVEQTNLSRINHDRESHAGPLEPLLIVVLHPGGAPAYRAEVGASQTPKFFTGGFQTDSKGSVKLPAPPDGDFKLNAGVRSVFPNPPPNCRIQDVVVTREHGSRWRYGAETSTTWHESSEPIVLRLTGPDCVK